MENRLRTFINENKWFIVFYLTWTFAHIVLLIRGTNSSGFWPFDDFGSRYYGNTRYHDYGGIEFFVYEALPLLIIVIYKLVGSDIKEIYLNGKYKRAKTKKKRISKTITSKTILADLHSPNTEKLYLKRSIKTIKQLKIFWFTLLGILVTSGILQSVYLQFTGNNLFDSHNNNIFINLGRLWIILFMFIFAYKGVKSSNFLNQQSSKKVLLAILWWFLGFISIWLLTIPIVLQNRKVKKKENELAVNKDQQ